MTETANRPQNGSLGRIRINRRSSGYTATAIRSNPNNTATNHGGPLGQGPWNTVCTQKAPKPMVAPVIRYDA